ncbi:flagellar protein FlgN [Desulfurispirillum indicum]|uniref:FlgN family protein n=1 Tax=Desulfurispirillum indicum (strain ATCC BAA-1389 / DSM 22839 / S5) TaxID=653733 RepID=E6W2E2_DESIS|nr:flagellar export chaperone FlgN [Desulfurispirillum indicum]ADU66692.1 hypothetical protein Selin_1965 [Desulfurispirillum indicum S5]UCZ56009.1 flagellar protein FlgN [Desulfurispirillum indicum]
MSTHKTGSATLAELYTYYAQLRDMLQENREHIVKGDVQGVDRVSNLMETLVLKIRLLEDTLDSFMKDYASTHDVECKLLAIAAHMEPEGGDFTDELVRLSELVKDVDRQTYMNRQILHSALKVNGHFLSLVDNELKSSKQYASDGAVTQKRQSLFMSQKV